MALSQDKLDECVRLLEGHNLATGASVNALGEVGAVSVKVPPFWTHNPTLWFLRLEAQFNNNKVVQDETKFFHVVGNLDDQVSEEIEDFLVSPPETGKYEALKQTLISAYGRTQAQKDAELLAITGMGDRRPSSFLRYLQRLNGDKDTLLRALFLHHLPDNIRANLAGHAVADIKALAQKADDIFDAVQPIVSAIASAEQVAAVGNRSGKKAQQSTPQTSQPPRQKHICHYHERFGPKAHKCFPWCMLWSAKQQAPGNC